MAPASPPRSTPGSGRWRSRSTVPYGLANPTLYAAQGTTYDVTKAPLAQYPGAVRVDYTNSENGTGGYTYSARWFDRDENLTIHVRPGYDDVTGVGAPNGSAWLTAVQSAK